MPQLNPWVGRTDIMGNRLEHMYKPPKQRARDYTRQIMGDLGSATGSAVGFAVSSGVRRFGRWYYPSEKINVSTRSRGRYRPRSYTKTTTTKKRKFKKKVCCRRIRGRSYCSPEFCDKRRKIKYWY